MFRRVLLCAALLAALSGAACAAGTLCVCAPGVTALTDGDGNELIGNGSCEVIFAVRPGALYAAGTAGSCRLYDANGCPLGDTVFSMIDDAGASLVYRADGLYGAMDAGGTVLLAPSWTQLTGDGEGGWLALDEDPLDDRPDEIIHLEPDGEARRTGVYTASGLDRVRFGRMVYMASNGLWGAVDARGRIVVEPVWRGLSAFSDGFARVSGPEGVGLIDGLGRVVLAPVYRWLDRSPAMIAACAEDGLEVYSPDGGVRRFALPGEALEASLVGDCLAVRDWKRAALYDAEGRVLDECSAGTTYAPGTAGQIIAADGAWGEACQRLLNPDGGTASPRFQQLLPLCDGRYAWLEMEGIEYYSAELGALQRSWDYDGMRYGLADSAGRRLTPALYREIRAVDGDRLLLIGDDETVLSDADGIALRSWPTAGG